MISPPNRFATKDKKRNVTSTLMLRQVIALLMASLLGSPVVYSKSEFSNVLLLTLCGLMFFASIVMRYSRSKKMALHSAKKIIGATLVHPNYHIIGTQHTMTQYKSLHNTKTNNTCCGRNFVARRPHYGGILGMCGNCPVRAPYSRAPEIGS